MVNLIRVKKSLGKVNINVKLTKNRNIVTQMPLHPEITIWPYTAADYKSVCDEVDKENQLHLTGDHEATKRMRIAEINMDKYYSGTAACVETFANQTDDAALPISMGFELYSEKKARSPKKITARDGNVEGDIIVEYPKLQGAASYVSQIAEVITGKDPVYYFGAACSITYMVIHNCKPGTKYLIILAAVYATGESPFSVPLTFTTAPSVTGGRVNE